MEKETDINKVFGKMPEAEELLDNSMEKETGINKSLKDGDEYRKQKDINGVFENCFISVTYGQPDVLLNNHDLKVLYDAMSSIFFEDVEWTWDFGDDKLKDGVYQCKITITDQDEFGIYFHIGDLSLITDFDSKRGQKNILNKAKDWLTEDWDK